VGEEERLNALRDELGLLKDELRSLSANRRAEIHRKCISNLYYAAFHAVRSLLLSHGLDAKTHEGTQRLFAAHFVKPGLFDKQALRTLATLESDRIRADYQGFHSFEAADVDETMPKVHTLVGEALAYLQRRDPEVLSKVEQTQFLALLAE
jgi:uncharacterized protein (UPF0332 family)